MENSVELDIIVKIANIGYSINYNNSSLDSNNNTKENANLEWNNNKCFMFIQFETKTVDVIHSIIVTLYPINNTVDYSIEANTYRYKFNCENITKIMNKYLDNDYYILLRNNSKNIGLLSLKYKNVYDIVLEHILIKKRIIFCLDSILKTIVKIPIIVQGRQVLRKYRVPPNEMVFEKLKMENNICHLNNLEGDRIFLLSILNKISDLIFNHIYIRDSSKQTDIFLYTSNINLNILSKNSYNGKTISAIFRIVSLIYSGVNIENIYYIVSNQVKKKNLESFWINYIEPYLGYVIKIYTVESFIKHSNNLIDHIFIDINYYNNIENIQMIEDYVKINKTKITYVGKIQYSQYFADIVKDNIVIDDLEFEKKEIIYKKYENISNFYNNENSIFILDNKVPLQVKNNIRNNISRDNIYNPKRVNIEILEGMEFASSYIIYNKISDIKLTNDILEEIAKRSSKECIIFLENELLINENCMNDHNEHNEYSENSENND